MLLTPWLAALKIRLHPRVAQETVELACGCLPPGCCGRRALILFRKQLAPAAVPVRIRREQHWRARQRLD